jgi:hypothetical protein
MPTVKTGDVMDDFGEVLTGYAIPQLLPMTPDGKGGWEKTKPIGNTGLTARIGHIAFSWAVSRTFRRRRFWYFGNVHVAPVFQPLQNSIEMAWMVEVLRVLDKAKFGSGTRERENLTVRLCHERFQSSAAPSIQQKLDEAGKYTKLIDVYEKADLEAIRNRAIFHLDYQEHQIAPRPTGDIGSLTDFLVDWFKVVAPVHYNSDVLRSVETSRRKGELVGRHYRRMILMYYRAEIGRPTKRKLSPKNIEFFKQWLFSVEVPDERIV